MKFFFPIYVKLIMLIGNLFHMKIKFIVPFLYLILFIFNTGFANTAINSNRKSKIIDQYHQLNFSGNKPSFEAFYKAMKGYTHLKQKNQLPNSRFLTLIDFSLSSVFERLWIIDMETMSVVHHTLVSHGRNTGDELAMNFSNVPNTYMTSLGFYITGDTYFGKHGLSLYLDGMEKGFNDNARRRTIVMHSADYATPDFIKRTGRLGRSFGCPAIPPDLHKEIIELIKGGTALFIYYPDQEYLPRSQLLL
jgi:hypothetical protein